MTDRGQGTGDRRQQDEGFLVGLSARAWVFVALAILLVPVFAHGCHGDDVDHEPVMLPFKLFEEE